MEVKEKIINVLNHHNLMHIATIDESGNPKVRGVDYAMGDLENELYFLTRKDSNKINHLSKNEQVSIAIDHDCPSMEDLNELKYIKATGKAAMIESQDETQKAMGLIIKKFPYLADIPGDPSTMVCVKVVLNQIILVDNTVSFGFEETSQYN